MYADATIPKWHPQTANVAVSQAKALARNLKLIALGKLTVDYEHNDLISMATVARNKAVIEFANTHFKGWWAWFIWMCVRLLLIRRLKKKIIISINWLWSYVDNDSSNHLIFKTNDP